MLCPRLTPSSATLGLAVSSSFRGVTRNESFHFIDLAALGKVRREAYTVLQSSDDLKCIIVAPAMLYDEVLEKVWRKNSGEDLG